MERQTSLRPSTAAEGGWAARRIAVAIPINDVDPWHLDCYEGILHYAKARGWACVVDPYMVGMAGKSGIGDYDGVVGRITPETAAAAAGMGIPVVNHWLNSPATDVPSVVIDHLAGARLAGEHLVACGYRHFGYIGITDDTISLLDMQGLTDAVTAKGLAIPGSLMVDGELEASRESIILFRQAIVAFLESLSCPAGLYVLSGPVARYLFQICSERGLNVPRDVGIVVHGADVTDRGPSAMISAVELDFFRVGYEAAELLDELMQGKTPEDLHRRVRPGRLLQRQSTDAFLCGDPLVEEAMRYIADHSRESLRVEDVAAALNTSKATLWRRFHDVLGRPISEEITRLRIEHVKRTLTECNESHAVIARRLGYSSAGQFSRSFHKLVGMTPSEFRRKHAEEDRRRS